MKLSSVGLSLGCLILIVLVLTPQKANAAALANARDTITTSRPSPSSPLSVALGSTDSQASIANNGSRFLASDSAKLIRDSGILIDTATIVASQSAALTTVYFAEQAGTAGALGTDVLFVPITAMHTLRFTIVNAIPDEGDLEVYFPNLTSGDADNDASPSATTFQFNNLITGASGTDNIEVFDDSSNITANVTVTETEPSSGNPGRLTIEFDSGPIAAGSTVTIMLGCSSAAAASACDTQVPRIINPTKTASAGTADRWKIRFDTEDSSDIVLDTASISIGTIDSVQVLATVDPTLTFTIAGINNATAVNNGNTTGCTQTETTNAGLASTATVVNLGILSNTPTSTDTKIGNIAAQLLSITTNGLGGYSLTATSSGPLRDDSRGYDIASNTTPAAFPNGGDWFGLHACGLDVTLATWNSTASSSCNTYITGSTDPVCLYGWPSQTTAVTLASDSSGPIGNSITAGNGLVSVSYASGVDASVPAGTYQTEVTYIATATF